MMYDACPRQHSNYAQSSTAHSAATWDSMGSAKIASCDSNERLQAVHFRNYSGRVNFTMLQLGTSVGFYSIIQ